MTYEELLTEIALSDERFIEMTAENRALGRNIPGRLGNRFIDTGITEQTLIGAAAGLALRGRFPVVHALASFLTMRAFEFIRTDEGIPDLPLKLSSFIPGFLSDGNGPTHQAIEHISMMLGIPNMTVFFVVVILRSEVLSVGLINLRSLKPVDERAIIEATRDSALTVTLEDHFQTGGLYSIVAEVLLKHGLTANVLPIALNERWFKPALLPAVLQHEGFTGKQIAEKILGYKTFNKQPEILIPQFSE